MPEITFILQVLIGVILAMVGFYTKSLREDQKALEKTITEVQINYVHKEELRMFRNEVIDLLKEVRQDIKEIKER